MPAPTDIAPRPSYPAQLLAASGRALAQLVRTPSHSRRAEAARKLARHSLWLSAAGAALVIVLMLAFDQTEIQLMPARGAPGLWPIRILTDFGKDEYVLSVLGGAQVVLALVAAGWHGTRRTLLLGLGTRLQFMFLSVALSVFVAEILKYLIGRGRPFVGGKANPFKFHPVRGDGGLCQPAVESCGDGVRAGVCGLGAVAAPARVHVHLRNRDPADAAGAARASPE
ncbi:hypothetical protein ACVW0I_004155 [Bradyrhizobium sp. LM6.11]